MQFERQDWTLFRNAETLAQHAGVSTWEIPALLVKELVDNALDAAATCTYGLLGTKDGFYVENPGEGFKGSNEDVAQLFSISRPLITTKFLRLPTRGRLGNGLRVVSGAVLLSRVIQISPVMVTENSPPGFRLSLTRRRRAPSRP